MTNGAAPHHPRDRSLSLGMVGLEKGICAVDLDPPEIETDLIDLTATSLRDLCEIDPRQLEPSTGALLSQLEHSRGNIGSGPPGRVD
jgi:hypothetical protein